MYIVKLIEAQNQSLSFDTIFSIFAEILNYVKRTKI